MAFRSIVFLCSVLVSLSSVAAAAPRVTVLAIGKAPTSGAPFCVSIITFCNSPEPPVTHSHVAGFIYVLRGEHTLQIAGMPDVTTPMGHAAFVGDSVSHTHTNSSATISSWIFLGVRAAGKCASLPPITGSTLIYASPDQAAPSQDTFPETLSEIPLARSESSVLHTGTTRVVLVLSGSMFATIDGKSRPYLAGQAFIEPATASAREIDGGYSSRLLVLTLR